MNGSDAERLYTDTPTTIVAQDRLSIYTGATTYMLGAGLWSESGNLELDTGELVFDNFTDTDQSTSFGINGSISFVGGFDPANSDLGGTFAYRDIEALTFATVGPGTIRVRDLEGFDFSGLNRDPDNMQRVISQTDFSIEIPGINLTRWTQQVRESLNLLQAVTTVPDRVRAEGAAATTLYQRMIFNNVSPAEARRISATDQFRRTAQLMSQMNEALRVYGSREAIPERIYMLMMMEETLLYTQNEDGSVDARVQVDCLTSGMRTRCEIAVDDIEDLLDNPKTREVFEAYLEADIRFLSGVLSRATFDVVDAKWYNISDNDVLNGLMGTLLWCAKNEPEQFVKAMRLEGGELVRKFFGEEVFGGQANLDHFLTEIDAADDKLTRAGELYAQNVGAFTRFWQDFEATTAIGTLDAAGFLANYIVGNEEERAAVTALMAEINEQGWTEFATKVGSEIAEGFANDYRNGDYASALGRLSGTTIDIVFGAKGTGTAGSRTPDLYPR